AATELAPYPLARKVVRAASSRSARTRSRDGRVRSVPGSGVSVLDMSSSFDTNGIQYRRYWHGQGRTLWSVAERRLADPGWYPDPANDRDTFRWWTGTAWTAWLTTDPGADPPPHGREDLGPAATAEVPPRPPARFGTLHRVAMAVVAAAVALAAVIVTGWPDRQRVVLSRPAPSAIARLPDLSVTCDEPWSIAGQVRMTTGGFLVTGPRRSDPLPYLHCRGTVDGAGGNTMVSLGMSDGSGSVEETLQD